jgi:hypothetical protein
VSRRDRRVSCGQPRQIDAVPIAEALWWHPMYERDPAHIWLRQTLAEAGRRITRLRSA